MESKIVLQDIEKAYGKDAPVIENLNLEIEEGSFTVLLGPSGCGKSTTLRMIAGLEQETKGTLSISGKDMKEVKPGDRGIAMVFQNYALYPTMTVKENIEVGAFLGKNPLDTDELLHTLGLWEHKDKVPSQLSGGQQQRTSIGRAIVKNPDILLCDEPTGALDYKTSKDILKLIETINQKYGNTVIIVTHNDAIKLMADKVIKLRDGNIRKEYENTEKVNAEELDW